jgi:hypothetical protein
MAAQLHLAVSRRSLRDEAERLCGGNKANQTMSASGSTIGTAARAISRAAEAYSAANLAAKRSTNAPRASQSVSS